MSHQQGKSCLAILSILLTTTSMLELFMTSVCQTSLQVSRAYSLQHLNIGGTFITDESLYAVANSCANLKVCLYCFFFFF